MATSGTVTITAKVNAEDAERRLQAIARAEREVGAEAARSNAIQAQSARAAADHYDKLSASQRDFQQQSRVAVGDVVKLSANLSVLGLAALEAKEHIGLVSTGVKAMGLLRGPVGIIAGLGALSLAAKAASESMEYLNQVAVPAAGKAEASWKSLQIVTERTGNSIREASETVRRFDDALTSATSAQQAVRIFNTMEVSQRRQIELMDSMRDGLVAMGNEANANLPLMARAIKQQNSELLDNMGVVSNIEQMHKRYAAALGTTVDKLTDAQREEAVMQGVLQETAKYAGSAAAAMETLQGKEAALATENRKLAEDVGNLALPFKKLGTDIEILGVKIERRLLDPLKEVRGYLGNQALTTWSVLAGGQFPTEQAQGEADMVQKTIKKLQAANAAERSRQAQAAGEGGYGPANIVDLNKFHEERAKREQAANERAEREAKQHAEQVAGINQQLRDRLSQLTMDRFDFERYQAQQAYNDEVKRGADRVLAAQVLSTKLKAIAKDEAEARSKYFEDLWSADTKRLTGQAGRIGASNVMGPFLPGQEATVMAVGDDTPAARQARKMEAEIGQYVKDWNKAADEAAEKQKKALEEGGEKVRDAIGQALSQGSSMLASSIRTGRAPSAGDMTRTGAAIAGGAVGMYFGGPAGIAVGSQAGSALGNIFGAFFDRGDDERALKAAHEQERLANAASSAADALRRHADRVALNDRLDEHGTDIKRRQQLLAARGDDQTTNELLARFDYEDAIKKEGVFRSASIKDLTKTMGPIFDPFGAVGMTPNFLTSDQLTQKIEDMLSDGKIDQNEQARLDAYGVNRSDFQKIMDTYNSGVGVAGQEWQAKLAELLDKQRVGLGTSADNPLYTEAKISNLQEMMAYLAPGQLMHATGPGTRRDDGMKGRAVNTRAV